MQRSHAIKSFSNRSCDSGQTKRRTKALYDWLVQNVPRGDQAKIPAEIASFLDAFFSNRRGAQVFARLAKVAPAPASILVASIKERYDQGKSSADKRRWLSLVSCFSQEQLAQMGIQASPNQRRAAKDHAKRHGAGADPSRAYNFPRRLAQERVDEIE
jgi:hypothetical protein